MTMKQFIAVLEKISVRTSGGRAMNGFGPVVGNRIEIHNGKYEIVGYLELWEIEAAIKELEQK